MTGTGALGPASRGRVLARLRSTTPEDPLDVLVVGGGVVGAGTALDAATRGLSTALVEATDYAWGTSSRSSKLVHGGLRYLEMLDLPLVHEALRERGRLIEDIAPHLVRPVPFLYPLAKAWERPYVGAGVALYDGLAAGRTGHLPVHRHLGRSAVARIAPGLRPDSHLGAIRYYDAQVDDARLVIELVRTAAAHGAHCGSRLSVLAYLGADSPGRGRTAGRPDGGAGTTAPIAPALPDGVTGITGAHVLDRESGQTLTVHARRVISATGVWTGAIPVRRPDGTEVELAEGMPKVTAAKGIHLVVPRERFTSAAGLILRTPTSVLFIIPWGRHWIIGTTDTPWDLEPDRPAATSRDIDYVLDKANAVLAEPLTRGDVVGVFAGLRPLVTPAGQTEPVGEPAPEPDSKGTAKISREHVVASPVPGLTVVAGGKLTTYRPMAADAVDAAAAQPGAPGTGPLTGQDVTGSGEGVPASCTEDLPLLGAQGWVPAWNRRTLLARESGLPAALVESLLHRYGSGAEEVIALAAADDGLARELPGLPGHLAAEAVHAVTHEGARSVQDVLARRIRAVFEADDGGAAAAGPVADLVAPLLGWDAARASAEAERYRRWVRAQRDTLDAATDEEAHALLSAAARGSVRDPHRGGLPEPGSRTSEFYAG